MALGHVSDSRPAGQEAEEREERKEREEVQGILAHSSLLSLFCVLASPGDRSQGAPRSMARSGGALAAPAGAAVRKTATRSGEPGSGGGISRRSLKSPAMHRTVAVAAATAAAAAAATARPPTGARTLRPGGGLCRPSITLPPRLPPALVSTLPVVTLTTALADLDPALHVPLFPLHPLHNNRRQPPPLLLIPLSLSRRCP